jgi:DNA-directed RNA polymerase specialized sigma24 family protein
VVDDVTRTSDNDPIGRLIEQMQNAGAVGTRERAARELVVAVHHAVYPMCLKTVGNPDDAYEAEHETVARLLKRISGDSGATEPIEKATAYVRQIAHNACIDQLNARRHDADSSVEDLDGDHTPSVADHADAMNTPQTAPTPVGAELIATFGYTSKRALADLECLTQDELKAVILRQEGFSYDRIATLIGAGLTPDTAGKIGERGLHKLRGIAHVSVWRQQNPSTWTTPSCPTLAELKEQVQRQLLAGKTITATLYMNIGKHLNPHPNRRKGETQTPMCDLCDEERERSRREYWWLLIFLLPFPLAAPRPNPRPTALTTGPQIPAAATTPPHDGPGLVLPAGAVRRRTARARSRMVAVVVLLLLLLLGGGLALLTRPAVGQDAADRNPQSSPAPTTPQTGSTTAAPGGNAGPSSSNTPAPSASTTPPDAAPAPGPRSSPSLPTDAAPGPLTVDLAQQQVTLHGIADPQPCSACSSGVLAGQIGDDGGLFHGYITFPAITAGSAGDYQTTVTYATAETRSFQYSINGGPWTDVTLPPTGGWTEPAQTQIVLPLQAGSNTLTIANHSGWAPNFAAVITNGPEQYILRAHVDDCFNCGFGVSAAGASFTCGDHQGPASVDCAWPITTGATVTIGGLVKTWGGDCQGTAFGDSCILTMDSDKRISAALQPPGPR